MSANPDQIVQQMHTDFQSLIAYVRDAESRTAAEVECTLFRRLLALGLQLLRLFFLTRAAFDRRRRMEDSINSVLRPRPSQKPIVYMIACTNASCS